MRFLYIFLSFIISYSSFAQVGSQFPAMETESLINSFINIPEDTKGKYTLIGLAFSKRSEDDLKTWFQPAYNQFIYQPETPSLFAGNYDVFCYFIPMFTGAKRPAYQNVMKKVGESLDEKLHPYVLFYKGSLRHYKDVLNFDGKDEPYFYVLDPEGKIVHATKGRYSDSKMQEIVDAVADAWK